MNISLNWLKKYIQINLDPNQISEILTDIGLEVEGVVSVETVKGGLQGIVVGQVLKCEKHPNADKLSITSVDVGKTEPLSIVCGAPNVASGQKVLVAIIGTTLFGKDGEPWKIKRGKIRGEVSEGMICAEDELGLGSNHNGIMVIADSCEIGKPATDYFEVGEDTIFEIGLTPNRSDATSHIGVAKDLLAYLKINHQYKEDIKLPDIKPFKVEVKAKEIPVVVKDLKACPRYSGVVISDVKVMESPDWLKKQLSAIGVRAINSVVDITNFVLHEVGQPLHAFDADKISGGKIIVQSLPEGTKFTSLDGVDRKLGAEDLMICDGNNNGMCIAGVFGGENSGVTKETKTIFLESAHFNAGSIRRTSTRHLLRTDAAKVYEKGSDPNITVYALKRAALLLKEICGGTISSEIIDIYPEEIRPVEITLKYDYVCKIAGEEISKDEIHDILRALAMEISPVNDQQIKVKVPTNKADVLRPIDLIEEILRIYGFNKVAIPEKINSTINFTNFPDKHHIKNALADFLSSRGFNEMMGMSLIESKYYREVLTFDENNLVFINNTSNIHLDIMRPEMMLSGLLSVVHNHNRQRSDLKLYEFGKAYMKKEDGYIETEYLTLFMSGKMSSESWKTVKSDIDFYDIKQSVNAIFQRLGLKGFQRNELESNERFSYGMSYDRGNNNLASFGMINEKLLNAMGIKVPVFYAEIPIKSLARAATKSKNTTKDISKYPSMRRDLAFVLDRTVKFQQIKDIAQSVDKKTLKEVNLFDVYENEEHLGKGKKSYAVSFIFEHMERTLQDKEIDKIMSSLQNKLAEEVNAFIRS